MNPIHGRLVLFLLGVAGVIAAPHQSPEPQDRSDENLIEILALTGGQTVDASGNLIPHPLIAVAESKAGVPTNMVRIAQAGDRTLPAFLAGRYEVTNLEFLDFLQATGATRVPEAWVDGRFPTNRPNHPVTGITREDALAYCAWLASHAGRDVSLPSRTQVRHLKRGATRLQLVGSATRAVGSDRSDLNNWGCYDVIGNAEEFTADGPAERPDNLRGFRVVMRLPSGEESREASHSSTAQEPPPTPYVGAYFVSHPQSQAVQAGAQVTLTARATALIGGNRIRYQWYFNGTSIAGATGESYTIANTQLADVGAYYVEASTPAGVPSMRQPDESMDQVPEAPNSLLVPGLFTVSDPAVIAIGSSGTPPSITRQPTNVTVLRGGTALATASFAGTPPLAARWRIRQSTPSTSDFSPTDLSDFQFTSDDSSTTLSYRNPPLYTVTKIELTVFGAYGKTTAAAAEIRVLAEGSAPIIASQPRSQSVTRGSNASFQVTATGSPAPSFQWFRNGTSLAGANADTLTLANVQDTEVGNYTVTATNSLGTVTSDPALLSLTAPPSSAAGGGGGGGAPSGWFIVVASILAVVRNRRAGRNR